jgi:hypothetical protein
LSQGAGAASDAPTNSMSEASLPIQGGRAPKLVDNIFLSIADKTTSGGMPASQTQQS